MKPISEKCQVCYCPKCLRKVSEVKDQGLYSPTILKNVLSLVHQIYLYSAAFEWFSQSEVVLQSNLPNLEEEKKVLENGW